MRLTFDLRTLHGARGDDETERRVTIEDLALMARRPRAIADLLWGCRYETTDVLLGGLPLNGVLAGAMGLAGLTRAQQLRIDAGDGPRTVGRGRYLARATGRVATLLPHELASGARLARRARRIAATPFAVPAAAGRPRSVAYLRPQPTLNYMGAYVGGAATHTTGVINGLLDDGVDVHVYATERPERTARAAFTPVPLRRLYSLVHWLTLFAYSDDLVAAAAPRHADAVYQRYALGSYAGLELAQRLRVPFVLEFNGSEIWAARHWGMGRVPLADTLLAMEERNLRDASLIVVVSDVLKEHLVDARGIPAEKVLVNPNGVDVAALARLRERTPAQWREATGRPEAPTVGFVGTFGLWHGVKVLPAIIDAVGPGVRWVLVGDGLLHQEVRDEIAARGLADRVELTGVLPHERTVEALAACDVFVSPHVPNPDGSRFFGSPTKLFEYMGLGRPVVASDLEQIGDVIEHERTGLLGAPGDAAAAAAAVSRLLGDAALRERLATAALDAAATRYSWAAHARRILDALDSAPAPALAASRQDA
jgi:glycosyltransferase involved in cell wall biosynthesis